MTKLFKHIFKFLFFDENSIKWLYYNNTINERLFFLYLLTLLIPFKEISYDKIYFLNLNMIINNLILLFVYFFILFIFLIFKNISFLGFLRIFLAIEFLNIFNILTIFMNQNNLLYYYSIVIGWYLTLSVYAVSVLAKLKYMHSIMLVLFVFILTISIPIKF